MAQIGKSNSKKTLIIIGIVLSVFIIIGMVVGSGDTNTEQSQEINNGSGLKGETEVSLLDAMRKCSVMEAFDIQTTGIGVKSGNAFNDGRETCNSMLDNIYNGEQDAFIQDTNTDWNTRSNERIDGKDMPYYLSILGW